MGWRSLSIGFFVAILVGAGLAWILERPTIDRSVPVLAAQSRAEIGGGFTLVDHRGHRVTEADFAGRYLLVFFGFTYCPDVCPAELQIISAALDDLGSEADKVQPLFVTVDPERDTVDVLADYVERFHPSLIGLTGSPEEIEAVAKAYRVYFAKVARPEGDDYGVNHSSNVYFMDPSGRFIEHFNYGTNPSSMAAQMRAHL